MSDDEPEKTLISLRDLTTFCSYDSGLIEILIALPFAIGDSQVPANSFLNTFFWPSFATILPALDFTWFWTGGGVATRGLSRMPSFGTGDNSRGSSLSLINETSYDWLLVYLARLSMQSKKAAFFSLSSIFSYIKKSSTVTLHSRLIPSFATFLESSSTYLFRLR